MNHQDYSGTTALMIEAGVNDEQRVNMLTQFGADVNIQNHRGETALIIAAARNSEQCLRVLLEQGADVNIQDHDGRTVLISTRGESIPYVETLLQTGADVNISDCRRSTVLHKVLENPDCDVVKCLKFILAAGANVNMANKRGENILKNATYQRHNPVVRTLLLVAGQKALRRRYNTKEFLRSHLCRDVIRKHLLQMNNRNLFVSVPKLGIPQHLHKLLLYNVSLEDA